ncbi:MAG: hypothetical protein HZC28_07765 [Spirochaetes bacterium]|nr:hypothetical protein [Spirochaetota bacterium]
MLYSRDYYDAYKKDEFKKYVEIIFEHKVINDYDDKGTRSMEFSYMNYLFLCNYCLSNAHKWTTTNNYLGYNIYQNRLRTYYGNIIFIDTRVFSSNLSIQIHASIQEKVDENNSNYLFNKSRDPEKDIIAKMKMIIDYITTNK